MKKNLKKKKKLAYFLELYRELVAQNNKSLLEFVRNLNNFIQKKENFLMHRIRLVQK
jgi:hypothetical protein